MIVTSVTLHAFQGNPLDHQVSFPAGESVIRHDGTLTLIARRMGVGEVGQHRKHWLVPSDVPDAPRDRPSGSAAGVGGAHCPYRRHRPR